MGRIRKNGHNSPDKKLTVQSLNEAFTPGWDMLCFLSSFVLAESLVLQNSPPSPSRKRLPVIAR